MHFGFSYRHSLIFFAALFPKATGNYQGIDIALLPPLVFLTGGVDVVVVDGAKRDGELIADFQAKPFGLRVAQVVGVRGRAAADQARLTGNEAQMLLRANSLRLTEGEDALVDLGARRFRR